MTLASHVRGPEFEPRCEYYHNFWRKKKTNLCLPDIFFLSNCTESKKCHPDYQRTVSLGGIFTACVRLKRLWSWYKPVLGLTTSFMERCGIVAYKFFQNWLRVRKLVSGWHIWAQTHQLSIRLTKMDDQKENTVSLFKETHNGRKRKKNVDLLITGEWALFFFRGQWWRRTPRSTRK